MKLAFCLFGIVGGRAGKNGAGGDVDFTKCYESYVSNIFQKHNVDVYIHTWSVQHEKALRKLYNPVTSLFEAQRQFETCEPYKADKFRSLSRWYSTQQVLSMVNGQYDWVMLSRFDLIWLHRFEFETLEPGKFYLANYNVPGVRENQCAPEGKKRKWNDLWIVGSQVHMTKLKDLYDQVPSIGNKEYDQHQLLYSWMQPYVEEDIRFKYYKGIDYETYRSYYCGAK